MGNVNTLVVHSKYEVEYEPTEFKVTNCLISGKQTEDGQYDFVNPLTFEIEHKHLERYLGISIYQYGKETITKVEFKEGISIELIEECINDTKFRIGCERGEIDFIQKKIDKHNYALHELRVLEAQKKSNE